MMIIRTLILILIMSPLGCDTSKAKYKMTVYDHSGQEVEELTRYASSLRYTAAGPMMVDAETGRMVSLPYVPEGSRVEVVDLETGEIVHQY